MLHVCASLCRYAGRCDQVTDCARTSIVFTEAAAVVRAAKYLLGQRSTVGFKNRFAERTPEGYADLMFTIDIQGYGACAGRPPWL